MKKFLKHATFFLFLLAVSIQSKAQREIGAFGMCSEGAWGFINVYDSTQRIPAIYCSVSGFSEGLAAVRKDGLWGYIDAENNVVVDFQFDYARSFKQDRAVVKVGEFYGVINREGKFVIPPFYYDLMPYELEGYQYYISRDSTFLQGVIDSVGREVLPHRYTYIMTYQPNLGKQRFYKNIPFYTVYQDIDSTKGSFYEQFKEDSYQFSPEKGRHDIYDLKFDKLASRNSTNYTGGFSDKELLRIDNFLSQNTDLVAAEKIKEVANLLRTPGRDTLKNPDSGKAAFLYGGVMTHDEIADHLAELGYHLFKNREGKIGLKKDTSIIIPAEHTFFRFLNAVIHAPMTVDISFLRENYAGGYRLQGDGVFDLFCIAAGDLEKGHMYTLSGKKVLTLEKRRMALVGITELGFKYISSTEGSPNQYGLTNWKGKEILPPVFKEIDVLRNGRMIVKHESKGEDGVEEYMGLYAETGEVVIPIGVYSEIKSFHKINNLYLATLGSTDSNANEISADENKDYAILKVAGNSYTVTDKFSATLIFSGSLDSETGMLPYRQPKERK